MLAVGSYAIVTLQSISKISPWVCTFFILLRIPTAFSRIWCDAWILRVFDPVTSKLWKDHLRVRWAILEHLEDILKQCKKNVFQIELRPKTYTSNSADWLKANKLRSRSPFLYSGMKHSYPKGNTNRLKVLFSVNFHIFITHAHTQEYKHWKYVVSQMRWDEWTFTLSILQADDRVGLYFKFPNSMYRIMHITKKTICQRKMIWRQKKSVNILNIINLI